VTSLRYLDAKFHHPSLGASPPNRGNRISCVQNSRKMENRNSVNNSGIGILCSKNSNERLAVPAVAGLLVGFHNEVVGIHITEPRIDGSLLRRKGRRQPLLVHALRIIADKSSRQQQQWRHVRRQPQPLLLRDAIHKPLRGVRLSRLPNELIEINKHISIFSPPAATLF